MCQDLAWTAVIRVLVAVKYITLHEVGQMEIRTELLCDGVDFISITEDRFLTNRISANIFLPLDKRDVSANAILPFLLRRACKSYPDLITLNRRLDELYGARLFAEVDKLGEAQVLTLTISAIDDRFTISKEKNTAACIDLLCELLFEPAFENGKFRQKDIEQERRQLIELIEGEINDKRTYARNRCLEYMCGNERYGINPLGTKDGVKNLSDDEILEAWRNALASGRIRFALLGKEDDGTAFEIFKEAISKIYRQNVRDCAPEIVGATGDVKEYEDSMPVEQAKLFMGFRAGIAEPDEDTYAMVLTAALFGGTPHSRLFLNVREKLSLCYYCAARYDRRKGVLLVDSGIEAKNRQKVVDEVIVQLECLKKGDFDDSELNAAKLYVANSFRSVFDSQGGLERWYINQIFDRETLSPDEAAARIEGISREKVMKCASQITLDTVYMLKGLN